MRPPVRPRPQKPSGEQTHQKRPPAPSPVQAGPSAASARTASSARTGSHRVVRPIEAEQEPGRAVASAPGSQEAPAPRPEPAPTARSAVSTGLAARLAERQKATRRRRLIRYGSIGCALVLVLALAWLVFLSPVFRLAQDRVELSGQGTVIAPGAVEDVVADELGTPLTVMDTVGLRNRILDVAGVRDVAVTRIWPNGLTIELTAREPVAAVPDGKRFTLRDDLGDVVGRAEKVPKGLPVIEIPTGGDTARILEAAIFMLNAIPADLHKEIKSVSASTPDAVAMELRDGATVLWGSQADADLKVRVFEVLRSAKETKGSKVFDVSAPNAPITR